MTAIAPITTTPAALRRHRALDDPIDRVRMPGLTRNSLRVVLGIIWLIDGALQLQSFMFTPGFARDIVAPSASGQPFFVAGPVEWNAHLIATHPALFNGMFASVQLALGLGFLVARSVRVAIVASILWAGGVWYLGEGLGGLAGGHVTALLGAPGAAALYVVLALAAWPGPRRDPSSPDARGPTGPPGWLLGAWAFLWTGFAVLSLLPSNGSARSISGQLAGNASMVPSWLASIDRGLASAVRWSGVGAVVVTAGIELAIGLLVLRGGPARTVALWTGAALAILYWGVGQSFGQLLSGQATDPNSGPLVVVLALAVAGACRAPGRPGVRARFRVDLTPPVAPPGSRRTGVPVSHR